MALVKPRSRSTLQPVAPKKNHRGSAGFRPAVFKDAGKDACASGTRQGFFNLPGVGYITTPRERALTALCRDLLRSYGFFLSGLVVFDPAVGAGGVVQALRVVFHGFRIEAFAAGEVARGLVTSLPCLIEKSQGAA